MPSLARDAAQKPNNHIGCLRLFFVREACNRNSLVGLCALALCTFPSTQQHVRHTGTYFGAAEQRSLVRKDHCPWTRAFLHSEQTLSTLPHVNISIQSNATSLQLRAGKSLLCCAAASLGGTDLGLGLWDLLLAPCVNNLYL